MTSRDGARDNRSTPERHFVVLAPGGGVVHGVTSMAREFVAAIANTPGASVELVEKITTRDIREIERLSTAKLVRAASVLRRWRLALKKTRRPVAVMLPGVGGFNAGFDALAARIAVYSGAELVLYLHGTGWARLAAQNGWQGFLTRSLFAQSRSLILLYESQISEVPTGGNLKTFVLPNLVDTASFCCAGQPVSSSNFKILFLSNLGPNKGVIDAIRIVHGVREQGVDAVLTIHGATLDPGVLSRASDEAVRLGVSDWITFAGPVYGPAKILAYQSHHCLVLPSYREAMPLVVLEAIACGLPVMAYDVGGVGAMIDSQSGCKVLPSGAWREGAAWLAELAADASKRDRASVAARNRAEEFSSARFFQNVATWTASMRDAT